MGVARDHEDSHERHGHVPKLIVAGRFDGTFDGRPVVITSDENGVVLRVSGLRSVWRLRKFARTLTAGLAVLKSHRVPLSLHIGNVLAVELLPQPHTAVKLLMPGLFT